MNDGIDKNDFPTVMGSVKKVVRMLTSCGEGAEFTKLDWAAAYKHIRVRQEDVQLQFFKWLDKYFAELALVFGSVSSAGIYDYKNCPVYSHTTQWTTSSFSLSIS